MTETAASLPEGALELGASGEAEWRRLGRQLYRSQGFWLGVLFADATSVVSELWNRARQRLALQGRPSLRFVAAQPTDLSGVYRWLEAQRAAALGCVWLEGIGGEPAAWVEDWTHLLVQLNRNRERLWTGHPYGVMLVLPLACKARFLQAAPDLWSIRSLVMTLPSPEPSGVDEGFFIVARSIEEQVRSLLLQRRHVIVIAPPGAGASTLRRRIIAALQDEGALCASLDLQRQADLDTEPDGCFHVAAANIGAQLGWDHPSRVLVGPEVPRLLFLDQSEAVLGFAAKRQALIALLHRAAEAGVTVCLLGAAFPASLWADFAAPISVQCVWLHDLASSEVPWAAWAGEAPVSAALQGEVWRWTLGHPALVRHLLRSLLVHAPAGGAAAVEQAIEAQFLETPPLAALPPVWRLRPEREEHDAEALRLYQHLLRGEPLSLGDVEHELTPRLRAVQALWLSGLVACGGAEEPGGLRVRGLLQAQLFDEPWADFLLLRIPTAPRVSLEEDYSSAVLHIAVLERPGETVLLLATVELLPHGMDPPLDDGPVVRSGSEGSARLHHLTMTVPEALRWYRDCAAGVIRIPSATGDSHGGVALSGGFTESCAWPRLLCGVDEDYPFRAGWHETPRLHQLVALQPDIERLGSERAAYQAWLEVHLQRLLTGERPWLGTVTLAAPNPVFRHFAMRLDDGPETDDILFRLWSAPGRGLGALSIVLYEERTMRPHVHRLPVTGRTARLVLDHRIRSQQEVVHDPQRGALYSCGPGVFLRKVAMSISVNGSPGLEVSLTP